MADISRNLLLTSQQDNDHYESQQSCISAGGATMTTSGHVNASRQKSNCGCERVVQQTGVLPASRVLISVAHPTGR